MTKNRHRAAVAAILLTAAGIAAAGCDASHGAPAVPAAYSLTGASGGSPQTQAAKEANALLAAFDGLTAGGISVPELGTPSEPAGTVSASWIVGTSSGAAFSAAAERLPQWPRVTVVGVQPPVQSDGVNSETVQTGGAGTSASVNITTSPGNAADDSYLSVTVSVVWPGEKPAAEHIPDSPVLTVSEDLMQPAPSTAVSVHDTTLTDRARIAQIAAEINALPPAPVFHGIVNCPLISFGTVLTLDFRDTVAGPPLAEVKLSVLPTGICGGLLTVAAGGRTQPGLGDTADPDVAARIAGQAGLPIPAR